MTKNKIIVSALLLVTMTGCAGMFDNDSDTTKSPSYDQSHLEAMHGQEDSLDNRLQDQIHPEPY